MSAEQPSNRQDDLSARIIRGILHVAVVALPLAMTRLDFLGIGWGPMHAQLTADAFDLPKAAILWALALVGLAVWAWRALNGRTTLFHTGLFWVVVILLGWIALATVLSVHPPTSWLGKYRRFEGLISFFSYAALFFLAVQVLRTAAQRRALARSAVLGGAVVALYGVFQYLGLDPVDWGQLSFEEGRAFSTFGNPELLGTYLVLPLLVAPALALSEERTAWRIAYGGCFLLLSTAWIVTFTRGAWIGGIVGLGLFTVAAVRGRARPRVEDLSALVVAAGLALVLVVRSLGSSSDITNVAARFRSILDTRSGSALTRQEIWESALAMVRDRPLVGHGPDTFRLLFREYETAAYSRAAGYLSVADNAHNYPLQLAAGVGIPGFLLLAAVFVWGLASTARTVFARPQEAARDRGESQSGRMLLAGLWCAIFAYLVSLLFSLSVVGSTPLLWVFLGAVVACSARELDISPPKGREVLAVLVLVAAALGLIADGRFVMADVLSIRSTIQPTAALAFQDADRAAKTNPWMSAYRNAAADLRVEEFIARREAYLGSGENPDARAAAAESYGRARAALEDARAYTPSEMDHYAKLTWLYLNSTFLDPRNADTAIATAQQGLLVAPNSANLRVLAAYAFLEKGDLETAGRLAREATELDPAFSDALALLGEIDEAQKNAPAAGG